jgi:hypothetical protein
MIFDPEDGDSKFIRNVAELVSYTVSDPRRLAAMGNLKSSIDNIKVFAGYDAVCCGYVLSHRRTDYL